MTPKQCRAARMAVGLSAHRLGRSVGLTKAVVVLFEGGELTSVVVQHELRQGLGAAGVEFISENGGGEGVRLRKA
jgi:hypothetical protein